jgi:hypothetical protein
VRNAFHHAQAIRIETDITYSDRLFRLRIRGDGRGIDPKIVEAGRTGHYGLAGMRERAARIGGQLNVWTGIGAGTEIELSIPGSRAYATAPGGRFWGLLRRGLLRRRRNRRMSDRNFAPEFPAPSTTSNQSSAGAPRLHAITKAEVM